MGRDHDIELCVERHRLPGNGPRGHDIATTLHTHEHCSTRENRWRQGDPDDAHVHVPIVASLVLRRDDTTGLG